MEAAPLPTAGCGPRKASYLQQEEPTSAHNMHQSGMMPCRHMKVLCLAAWPALPSAAAIHCISLTHGTQLVSHSFLWGRGADSATIFLCAILHSVLPPAL